jgi:hypothetical protein
VTTVSFDVAVADCRFLTIAGPGGAREFFEDASARLTRPPDMAAAIALAGRHEVEVAPAVPAPPQ